MHAIYIQKHGAVQDIKVSEVPAPSVKPGDVLVKVEAAGINPSDLASVEGKFPNAVLPRVVGRDFAGRVVEGPAELQGAEVWGTGGDLGITRDGTHAEFIAVPRDAVARRPKTLTVEQAGAGGVPFITAYSALIRLGKLKAGDWVIVSGAAGAVGQAAIQIANANGARIVALVRDASESWAANSPGVRATAYSDKADLETVVREATSGEGASVALNGVGSSIFGSLLKSLKTGGRLVVYSAAGGRESNLDIMYVYRNDLSILGLDTQKLDASHCANILNELAPLFHSGALKPPNVAEKYPLANAAEAYARVAAGNSGKVVLVME